MKYLIDAQLPLHLKKYLEYNNIDVLHILDLDSTGTMSDATISKLADSQNRVVISKDIDFYNSHFVNNSPKKLLLVTTGNITNQRLVELFKSMIFHLNDYYETSNFIELTNDELIIH